MSSAFQGVDRIKSWLICFIFPMCHCKSWPIPQRYWLRLKEWTIDCTQSHLEVYDCYHISLHNHQYYDTPNRIYFPIKHSFVDHSWSPQLLFLEVWTYLLFSDWWIATPGQKRITLASGKLSSGIGFCSREISALYCVLFLIIKQQLLSTAKLRIFTHPNVPLLV